MGVSIHYSGKLTDISTINNKMDLLDEKIDDISSDLSNLTGARLEKLSADDLSMIIEALLKK